MKTNLFILIISLILVSKKYCKAQNGYTVNHYTIQNGLPQNSVKSIASDSKGFIWLATEDGLARFDGRHFYVYTHQVINVSNNRVFSIKWKIRDTTSTAKGRNKVSYASFINKEIVRIENGIASFDTLSNNAWLKNLKQVKLDASKLWEANGLPDIRGLEQTPPEQYLIFAGNDSNNFYLCKKKEITYYGHWIKKYNIKFPASTIWNFFSLGQRLYYVSDAGRITTIFDKKIRTAPLSGDILTHASYKNVKRKFRLYWNTNSDQAFIYFEKNLYILEQQNNGTLVTRLLIEDFDLTIRSIEQIHFDNTSQKIFLGSRIRGLFILTKHQFQIVNVKGGDMKNVFYAQIPYDSHSVMTPRGEIVGKNPVTRRGIEQQIPVRFLQLSSDTRGIVRDNKNNIWIKSDANLFYLDDQKKKSKRDGSSATKLTHFIWGRTDRSGSASQATASTGLTPTT